MSDSTERMREEFEKFAREQGWYMVKDSQGFYDALSTQCGWEGWETGWRAATSAALEEVCELIDRLKGPTGGWVDSPETMKKLIRALKPAEERSL